MTRDRKNNPYAPGAGVPPPELAGRIEELQVMEVFLARRREHLPSKSLIITGPRGVGKTVLLNRFEDMADAEGWVSKFYELSGAADLPTVLATMARQALLEMSTKERWREHIKRPLRALRSLTVSLKIGDVQLDVEPLTGVADSGIVADDLRDVFMEIGRAAERCETGVIFLLDELQNAAPEDYEAMLVGLHRVDQKSLPLGIVGAGLPLLPELTGQAKSYAERMFEFVSIGRLSADAATNALAVPAAVRGVAYDDAALDLLLKLSGRYPYFLQEYGKFVWTSGDEATITPDEVRSAAPIALDYLDEGFFRVRMARTTRGTKRYLIAMASLGEGPYQVADVWRAGKYKTLQATSPVRMELIKQGLIFSPERGLVDFTVPHFADYIRRRVAVEE